MPTVSSGSHDTFRLPFSGFPPNLRAMSKLLSLAVLLLIAWIVLRLFLAVTGFFLHALWIVAIILFVMWLLGKLRGGK